ncbi:tetratricopeptide repeat-containing sensor histidine kinase [Pedobacter sp. AW31-3R]|uniref:tetratricopeptide repeat-containing sensor histidine kinase n=1 Tax=Pedobacter sp. AW31-3R TaxID=3445781 RepID=UPI003FA02224
MKYSFILSICFLFFLSCTNNLKKVSKEDNPYYDQAFVFLAKANADSAFLYFNKAKDLFLQKKDSLGAGKCLVNMGIISTDKGDYFGAQELSLNALAYFDHKNKDQFVFLRSNFNNLGIATHQLRDYKNAVKFYNSAIFFSTDSLDTRVYLNNKALIYQKTGDYKAALQIYSQLSRMLSKNKKEQARVLTNISYTRWLQNARYNPVPDYLKALKIRKEENDLFGQNASYSHLSDYYAVKRPDSAFLYADLMYQVARKLDPPENQLEALQKLIKLSAPKAMKQYFETYYRLDDSLQNVRRAAKNQFALIRYETEKHKADFLKVQAENIQKENDILKQYFALGALLIMLVSGYFWYRKRQEALKQENELEVKNTELKYVKKIHDRVANKVYHVMSEIENSPGFDRDILLDKLEVLYNVSRDISYESKELNVENNYAGQLSEMLQSYSSGTREILIVGNEEELWQSTNSASKEELFFILQELMTNMKKHSKAGTVILKFHCANGDIRISYIDNGVGMTDASKKNGLTNTENRIKSIRGTITFDNTLKKGLGINLSFPFS